MIVEKLQEMIHDNAEYISGGLTYILSMVSLNIHLSTYGSAILVKLPIFFDNVSNNVL